MLEYCDMSELAVYDSPVQAEDICLPDDFSRVDGLIRHLMSHNDVMIENLFAKKTYPLSHATYVDLIHKNQQLIDEIYSGDAAIDPDWLEARYAAVENELHDKLRAASQAA
jgi:hypothetical protein